MSLPSPEKEQRLAALLAVGKFTRDDLERNRAGVVSSRQRLAQVGRGLLIVLVALVPLGFLVADLVSGEITRGNLSSAVVGLIFAAVLLMLGWDVARQARKMRVERVLQHAYTRITVGPRSDNGRRTQPSYVLQVRDMPIEIGQPLYNAFSFGEPLVVYYDPTSLAFLSAEPEDEATVAAFYESAAAETGVAPGVAPFRVAPVTLEEPTPRDRLQQALCEGCNFSPADLHQNQRGVMATRQRNGIFGTVLFLLFVGGVFGEAARATWSLAGWYHWFALVLALPAVASAVIALVELPAAFTGRVYSLENQGTLIRGGKDVRFIADNTGTVDVPAAAFRLEGRTLERLLEGTFRVFYTRSGRVLSVEPLDMGPASNAGADASRAA